MSIKRLIEEIEKLEEKDPKKVHKSLGRRMKKMNQLRKDLEDELMRLISKDSFDKAKDVLNNIENITGEVKNLKHAVFV